MTKSGTENPGLDVSIEQLGIALAVLGILIALTLAVVQAFGLSKYLTLGLAVVATVVILLGSAGALDGVFRAYREEVLRQRSRKEFGLAWLAEVTGGDEYLPGAPLSSPIYGFEEIFAVKGLQDGSAKIKPTVSRPDGSPYPLEVHVTQEPQEGEEGRQEIFLVGFVSLPDRQLLESFQPALLTLWTRQTRSARFLVRVPVAAVEQEASLGRTSNNLSRDIFRLQLRLAPRPSQEAAPATLVTDTVESPAISWNWRRRSPAADETTYRNMEVHSMVTEEPAVSPERRPPSATARVWWWRAILVAFYALALAALILTILESSGSTFWVNVSLSLAGIVFVTLLVLIGLPLVASKARRTGTFDWIAHHQVEMFSLIIVACVCGFALLLWYPEHFSKNADWYTKETALIPFVGVVVAVFAAFFVLPDYTTWQRQLRGPQMRCDFKWRDANKRLRKWDKPADGSMLQNVQEVYKVVDDVSLYLDVEFERAPVANGWLALRVIGVKKEGVKGWDTDPLPFSEVNTLYSDDGKPSGSECIVKNSFVTGYHYRLPFAFKDLELGKTIGITIVLGGINVSAVAPLEYSLIPVPSPDV